MSEQAIEQNWREPAIPIRQRVLQYVTVETEITPGRPARFVYAKEIAEALGCNIVTIRKYLRELYAEDRVKVFVRAGRPNRFYVMPDGEHQP